MELREKIAEAVFEKFGDEPMAMSLSRKAADAILAIPEIAEALEDKRRDNLLREMVGLDEEMGLYDDKPENRLPPREA